MGFNIDLSRDLKDLLGSTATKGLVADVRKNFERRSHTKIKQAIIQDMIRGISPVEGEGKYDKYSDSYKEVIRGEYIYRNVGGGKVIRYKGKDEAFHSKSSPTKSISPVNLRHSGALHKSLKSFFQGNTLIIQFKHFLADIHNRRGAGKSKTVRRMLPTESGEEFNNTINKVIIAELRKAVDKVAKQFSGR